MNGERVWFAMAIYRFYRLSMDLAGADGANETHVEQFNAAFHDLVVFAAHVLLKDRDEGRSYEEVDSSIFDELLREQGLSEEECVQARNMRRNVILLANRTIDEAKLRRGDDSLSCDPGGGMRGPDDANADGRQ